MDEVKGSTTGRSLTNEQWKDWTAKDGCSNSSELFERLEGEIERVIRTMAHDLIRGRAEIVAGLILARLAHKFRLGPTGEIDEDIP